MNREFKTKELKYVDFHVHKKENELPPVLVADSICGSGKTQAAIEYINTAPVHTRFLYVTPYITEIERIITSCPNVDFYTPDVKNEKGSKMTGFQYLFDKGENIVCTHKLFSMFTPNNFKIAEAYHYTLIMDEVADVVQKYSVNSATLWTLFNPELNYVHVDESTNQIILNKETDFFEKGYSNAELLETWGEQGLELIEKIKNGCIYLYGSKYEDILQSYKNGCKPEEFSANIIMWAFPVEIFKSFEKVFILTYMFSGQYQANYYKYFDIPYKYLHTEPVGLRDENTNVPRYQYKDQVYSKPQEPEYAKYKDLIEIAEGKINLIGATTKNAKGGEKNTALCKNWYIDTQKSSNNDAETLKKNTFNFFNNMCKVYSSKDIIWTTFLEYKNKIKKAPFSKESCFVSCNARATNEYQDRHCCAYLINVYMDPFVRQFFLYRGIEPDQETYALSELIQWLFRSAIRQGEPIKLYIPSQRMRELLEDWLDGNYKY